MKQSMIFACFVFSVVFFSLAVGVFQVSAQTAGDLEITEVMYHPRTGGEWIEIINTSDAAIDITALKVKVGDTETAIAVVGDTVAELAAGAIAIITTAASTFSEDAVYVGYEEGPLYTSAFSLPETDATKVSLVKADSTEIHAITYNPDPRSDGTSASLHLSVGNTLIAAPATPGENAVNPLREYAVARGNFAVIASVQGGTLLNGHLFVSDNDVLTIDVVETESVSGITAQISFGDNPWEDLTGTTVNSGTTQRFIHTIVSGNQSGIIRYRILKDNNVSRTSDMTHEGNPVAIDRDTPSTSFVITPDHNFSRKTVTATITDSHPPEEVHYKLHTNQQCTNQTQYDSLPGTEESVALLNDSDTYTAEAVVWDTGDNDKYLCMKITDLAGKTQYSTSSAITGIIDSLLITELNYDPGGSASSTEWIEIHNTGLQTIVLTDYELLDGNNVKPITVGTNSRYSPVSTLAPGEVGIIAKNPEGFVSDFTRYDGPLLKTPAGLNNDEDIVGIRLKGTTNPLDRVRYTDADGADGNGNTLHIARSGIITEDTPSPGAVSGIVATTTSSGNQPSQRPANSQTPTVTPTTFDGISVSAGQNLFFTTKDAVNIILDFDDDTTDYTSANLDTRLEVTLRDNNERGSETARIEQRTIDERSGGLARVTYEVLFSPSAGTASDNRVKLFFALTDADGNTTSKRSIVTIVRNTTTSTFENSTSASILGFSALDATNVIVPITISNLAFGDWLALSYTGTCGEALTKFIVRNGGSGLLYELGRGERHQSCAVTASDTAGNADTLNLPTILIAD